MKKFLPSSEEISKKLEHFFEDIKK